MARRLRYLASDRAVAWVEDENRVVGLSVRAVAAGSFAQGSTEAGLSQGLREQGWLVEEVDFARHFEARTLAERVERRLRWPQNKARFNADIVAACERTRPEVMLTVKGIGISRKTLDRLGRLNVRTVNFFPDYYLTDVPWEALQAYSNIITTKSFQLDYLRSQLSVDRVDFVHHGYLPLLHRASPTGGGTYTADIVYIGNASPYKARMLTPLVNAFPRAIMRIYGGGWDPYRTSPLSSAIVGHRVAPDFMADVISHARVNVALHMGLTESSIWEDFVSTRTFEIPACGGFMLHIDNEEVRSLYQVPEEIDVFANAAELIAKTRYYLEHAHEREAIAARGHARAVPAYSYSSRAAEVAAIIEPLLKSRGRADARS
ncbi:MAG: glycosyltransferase [Sphingomicrobium sp.]